MDSQLILVAIKGKHTQVVFGPAIPKSVGGKKSELMNSGNWKGWTFQLRTQQGYDKVKILIKKPKTYEEKRAA